MSAVVEERELLRLRTGRGSSSVTLTEITFASGDRLVSLVVRDEHGRGRTARLGAYGSRRLGALLMKCADDLLPPLPPEQRAELKRRRGEPDDTNEPVDAAHEPQKADQT